MRFLLLIAVLLWPVHGWAAFTKTAECSNSDANGGTATVSCTVTLTSGRLLVVATTYEGADTTTTVTDGTNTYTGATSHRHANNDVEGTWFYVLSHTASGSTTVTLTLGANRQYKRLAVYEASYSGTASFDARASADCPGSDPCTSGNITTTGTGSEFAVGHISDYSGSTKTSPQINGVVADGSINPFTAGHDAIWYWIASSTFTGAATVNNGPSDGIGHVIVFKENTSAAAGCRLLQDGTSKRLLQNGTTGSILQGGGDCGFGGAPSAVPVRMLMGVGL